MRLIGQNRDLNVPYELYAISVVNSMLVAFPANLGEDMHFVLGEYNSHEDAMKVFDDLMRFAKANAQLVNGLYFVPKRNGENDGVRNIIGDNNCGHSIIDDYM